MGTLLLLSLLALGSVSEAPRTVPAQRGVEAGEGTPPYEILWARRTEPPDTAVRFNDMGGWSLRLGEGCEATLIASKKQVLWSSDNPTAHLRYKARGTHLTVVLRPPEPLPIPPGARACELWCYGNNWGWAPDPQTPQVTLALLLRDKKGTTFRETLTRVRWKGWWLIHRRFAQAIAGPSRALTGIEVTGPPNRASRSLFFESLRFTHDEMKPLRFPWRPRRNLRLFPGQDPGLNKGPGTLPFPTREETILPENLTKQFSTSSTATKEGFLFTYRGEDGALCYHVQVQRSGGLPVVTVRWNESSPFTILKGAEVALGASQGSWKTEALRFEGGVLTVTLQKGNRGTVTYRFQLRQKSLLWDVFCRGGVARELGFGWAGPFESCELIPIPYLTYGLRERDPGVLLCRVPGGEKLFLTVWPDWYRSNASEPFSDPRLVPDEKGQLWASVNGGVRYLPKTDTKRNDLFERIFITVSPTYEEVLPQIANPPSALARHAGCRLWQETWGPSNYKREEERSRRLRNYGIRYLTQLNHEITWRDEAESFTLRLRAAPKKGGDAALKSYLAHQKALGWLAGLYTNYTDFAPVNANWNPDYVQRTPECQLRTAWPRCYALKPAQAVVFDRFYAPRIKEKFKPTAAYTDVHTAVAPWRYCDFDDRVPGAGTFAQTFYLYGELLLHDQSVYGPTWSEGTYQWLYAGLATGNYGLCYTGVDLSTFPLLVVFDLRQIHPRECDIGMPWTTGFLKGSAWRREENLDHAIDHFLAATVAYGHIGWLVEERYGIRRTCRSYYMLRPIQCAYAQVPVRSILYHDPERHRLVSVSEALASGVWRRSRLAVVYENGLAVYVNSDSELWILSSDDARSVAQRLLGCLPVLPQWGYLAVGPDVAVYSGLAGTHRVDLSLHGDVLYVDARQRRYAFPFGLTCRGAVAIRKEEASSLEIIAAGGNDWISLGNGKVTSGRSEVLPVLAGKLSAGTIRAYSDTGEDLGEVLVRPGPGRVHFRTKKKAAFYKFTYKRLKAAPVIRWHTPKGLPEWAPGKPLRFDISVPPSKEVERLSARLEPGGPQASAPLSAEGLASFSLPAVKASKDPLFLAFTPSGAKANEAFYELVVPLPPVRYFPFSLSFHLDEEPLRLLAEIRGALKEDRPKWLHRIDMRPVAGELFEVAFSLATQPASIPPKGRLFGFEYEISRKEPVFVDLLERTCPRRWVTRVRGKEETPGDPESGATCVVTTRRCGGAAKRCLFTHPPYRRGVGYTAVDFGPIQLPRHPVRFLSAVGIADGGAVSDGALLSVWIGPRPQRLRKLSEKLVKRPGWSDFLLNLEPFRSQRVFLRLKADVGPNDNSHSDWVCWGEARLVEAKPRHVVRFSPRPAAR